MGRETLECFLDLAVTSQEKNNRELKHLTEEEYMLYGRLMRDYYGENIRLEQERMPFSYLQSLQRGLHAFR